jgi:hypothetical protein
VTRPHAADDFAAIRARMEELQRQRARPATADDDHESDSPRPYAVSSPSRANGMFTPAVMRRLVRR